MENKLKTEETRTYLELWLKASSSSKSLSFSSDHMSIDGTFTLLAAADSCLTLLALICDGLILKLIALIVLFSLDVSSFG